MKGIAVCVLGCVTCFPFFGQGRVSYDQMHEVALLVVPLTGNGTAADPRRPAIMPVEMDAKMRRTVISWSWQAADDGRTAIVEITVRDKVTLREFTRDARVVKAFERGKDRASDVERELKLLKKDFRLPRPEVKKP